MRFSKILLTSFVFFVVFGLAPKGVWALDATDVADSCSDWTTMSGSLKHEFVLGDTNTFDFILNGLVPNSTYKILFREQQGNYWGLKLLAEEQTNSAGSVHFVINDSTIFPETPGNKKHELILNGDFRTLKKHCVLWNYSVTAKGNCEITTIKQERNGQACFYNNVADSNSCIDRAKSSSDDMTVIVKNIRKGNQLYTNEKVTIRIDGRGDDEVTTTDGAGSASTTHKVSSSGTHTIRVYPGNSVTSIGKPVMCEKSFRVSLDCDNTCLIDEPEASPRSDEVVGAMFELCTQITDKDLQAECNTCASEGEGGDENQAGIWTAIGCIKRSPTAIIQRLVTLGLGIGGGVSLIMTLAGGFILTTSQGDPKRTGQAKEMITNAIIGLIFVIFSVTILQFMGYTVLRIPGFGTP
ncbi:MAG: hypothetical protein GW947_03560 [Candidatus Pacebacteria bacterium]|nr:hypothetical protein [Candidatus Paceibacterota bacterium]PIR59734.1 MAG: hypothetical protein COU68_03990 [Candidatus Pacebacteria bacterium CG10_big_fil_rev_8_21_14_0_10_45_6]